jgi:uncharacterized membrane protein
MEPHPNKATDMVSGSLLLSTVIQVLLLLGSTKNTNSNHQKIIKRKTNAIQKKQK